MTGNVQVAPGASRDAELQLDLQKLGWHELKVTVEAGGRDVRVSNPDRVIFPESERSGPVTKLDVVEYYLAVGDGILRLWDPDTGRERSTMTGPTSAGYRAAVPIGALAFSHDGATIAAGRQDGSILLLDVPAGTLRASLLSDEDKRPGM